MNNIWLITKREYWTRVKNKTFLLTTFLTPLGILLFIAAAGFIFSQGSDDRKEIYVLDHANLLEGELNSRDNLQFTFTEKSLDTLLAEYERSETDGILELKSFDPNTTSKYEAILHADKALAIDETFSVENAIRKKIRNYKLKALAIDDETINKLSTNVSIAPKSVTEEKEISSMTNVVGSVLGGVVSYAMFFIILLYGAQVMRSVTEEKINRIVEVLISSVKPFELMMGKVLGVGLVGLTQIGIWMILMPVIFSIATLFLGVESASSMDQLNEMAKDMPQEDMAGIQDKIATIMHELAGLNWLMIIPLLLFYFLGGYFAYAALFAAVGAAVGDDVNEAQSLTLPIMLPLIFAIYIGISAVSAPHSNLAAWSSMIPLLSSIVMPVRLPSDPPFWQIIISVVLLAVFCIFFIWLAARIYRVGILMYGKKASFKELGKWIFYKG